LERYARDLTQAAREGKIDPVIGRDEEIRRTIKFLRVVQKIIPYLLVILALEKPLSRRV